MSDAATHDAPGLCENCATPLRGEFCYDCGQSAHSPLRHAGHAIEEVFESFWHLDGRIFRTLRGLWSPGRLANAYLAGHRAPYVAPLRLFVILSVLTFFVAQYAVHFAPDADGGIPTTTQNGFRDAKTVADVERQRDEAIKGLQEGKAAVAHIPAAGIGFDRSIKALRRQARARIAELDPRHPSLKEPLPETDEPTAAMSQEAAPDTAPSASSAATSATDRAAEPKADDGFFGRWLEKKGRRAEENWGRFQKDPELLKSAVMKSIPTALFFLVPVFAVFLKLAYVETHRLYLEHLVVALYSHAWLCLALLSMCLLVGLDAWITPYAGWFGHVIEVLKFILLWWMPIYLLLMQKRVYGQAWWLTALKYCVIGTVYMMLVTFAAVFVAINSFINM